MSKPRLTTAVDDGLISLLDGPIRVIRPPVGYDLSALPKEHVLIDSGFKPECEYWESAGFALYDGQDVTASLVVVPRSKEFAKILVSDAAASSNWVLVDGQKTDGVDSLFKACRSVLGDLPSVTKGHGRLFWFERTEAFADWAGKGPAQKVGTFVTQPGVFSEASEDRGSKLLLSLLPEKIKGKVADLGAGWGYLSAHLLSRPDIKSLDLVEAERLALDCAEQNVTDERAAFHWADVTNWKPATSYDCVVMNPPFHTGREGSPALGIAFIQTAARVLTPSGHLWMVANRHLPYEAALREKFRNVDEVGGDGGFKVFHASRPIK